MIEILAISEMILMQGDTIQVYLDSTKWHSSMLLL